MRVQTDNPIALAKRVYWLAWKACGSPVGMGFLQNRPDADEEAVWQNIQGAGDYPSDLNVPKEPEKHYADYVFGRMMKLGLTVGPDFVEVVDREVSPDYQSWSRKYPSCAELLEAAVESK